MVNATLLCKAGGKEFREYNRNKQTKDYLQVLKSDVGIPTSQLIICKKGNSSKYDQGTWVHRKVAIHLAQWISPSFAVQVTNWLDELLITGQVTLGQEKSNKEIEEAFQKKLDHLQHTVEMVVNENLQLKSTHSHLAKLHDDLRMKRNYHKFKKGNCIYIVTDRWREKNYLKIGYTDNINARLRTYRTSMPDCKINYLLYLTENKLLEKCIKTRYEKKLIQKNHEYVIDISEESLIKCIKSLVKYLNMETTEETTLALYNEPYKTYNLVFVDQDGNIEENIDKVELDSEDNVGSDKSDVDKSDVDPIDHVDSEKSEVDIEDNGESEKSEPDTPEYKCKECGKVYQYLGKLELHLANKHGQTQYVSKECSVCKKEFTSRNKMLRHVKSVHEKVTVKCKLCDKDFNSQSAVNIHIKNVHKKLGACKCEKCGNEFKSKGGLQEHMKNVHDRTTDIKCDKCTKVFHSLGNLQQHIKTVHTERERLICEICGNTYSKVYGLRYHMKNKHNV